MDVPEICAELQALQKWRAWHMKSRIMNSNRLQATVAGTLGYRSGMTKPERLKVMAEANKLIKEIAAGRNDCEITGVVVTTMIAINGFRAMQKQLEKEMLKLVKQLPVAKWVEEPEQRGFGLPMLAVVIGETGDLSNYANPGKVWRRLGCAPYIKDGETHMGATWRSRKNGKVRLCADDWEEFGYSPRRRSIAFLIGEGLLKQNFIKVAGESAIETERDAAGDCDRETDRPHAGDVESGTDLQLAGDDAAETEIVGAGDRSNVTGNGVAGEAASETEIRCAGPYRLRYLLKKADAALKHPEWICCPKCEGAGTKGGKKCTNCKGSGEVWMHCHRHGMLLATKLLLKNLRIAWGPMESEAWAGEVRSETA